MWAFGRFRDLIFGSRVCDYNPLQYIRESSTNFNAKLLQWSLASAELDLDI